MAKQIHGHSINGGSPTYKVWYSMLHRCEKETNKRYSSYGGRGITVCDSWHLFGNFLADMGVRPEGMTLDRIDTNGNYEPSNCRCATYGEQSRNTTRTLIFTYDGKTMCVKDWCSVLGIAYQTLLSRIKNNKMSFEEAVTTPIKRKLT